MVWGVADFAVFGSLLVGAGVTCEVVVRKTGDSAYRFAIGVAVAAAFLLVFVNGAVGVIGNEDNDANLMYGGVLAIGIIGALIARFQPHGMARALSATVLAQPLVAVVAVGAGWGSAGPIWPWDILIMTGFFAALWLVSAGLFQKAARAAAAGVEQRPPDRAACGHDG